MMRLRSFLGLAGWEAAALAAGLVGLLAAAVPLPTPLSLTLVGIFLAIGPGAVLQSVVGMPAPIRWLVVPMAGLSVALLGTSIMAAAAWWQPRVGLAALAVLVMAAALLRLLVPSALNLRRLDEEVVPLDEPSARGDAISWGLLAAALVAWLVALPTMAPAPVDLRGLLFAASPLFAISLLLAGAGFLAAVSRAQNVTAGVALLLGVLLTRLPTAMAVTLPLYSWTYKHLGVIDYIATNGHLDRGIDIYHSWPGMFALFAWIDGITGSSSLVFAQWFTPVYQVFLTGAIFVLARGWGFRNSTALVAAFIAHTVNWVAQDYFSPQAVAMLLAVTLLAILVQFRARSAAWTALLLFAGIVVTHQLTPYWLLVVLVAWSVLKVMRPYWAVAVFVAVTGLYLGLNYDIVRSYGSLLSFNPFANAARNVSVGDPSAGQKLTSLAGRLASVGTWALTSLTLGYRFVKRIEIRRNLALASLALGSFSLLLGQGYGGEAIFRVFLYSTPGCALVLAPVVERWLAGALWRRVAAWLVALLVVLAAAQAFYGAWFANRVSQDSYAAATRILLTAPTNALMIELTPGAPGRTVGRYTEFAQNDKNFDSGVLAWDGWQGADFSDTHLLDEATASLLKEKRPTYIIISEQGRIYNDYYGIFPAGALDRFQAQLLASPYWELTTQTPSLLVFQLKVDAT